MSSFDPLFLFIIVRRSIELELKLSLQKHKDKMGSLGGETAKKAMWLYPKVLGFNPSERWGHSACYSHGAVYIFGGCCGGLHFSDVLVLNLDRMVWNTIATTGQGPGPRDSHSAVLVGHHRMIVFGGTNGSKKVNDLHILDLGTKQWAREECKGTPPTPRESHTATLVGDDKMVIFGGSGEGEANCLNDLHVLDLKTMRWTSPEVKGDIPVPRDSHSAVAIGNKLFVYGGDCGDRYNGDADVLDMDTFTWSRLAVQGSTPGVRAGHAAVNIGMKVYVIGGVGDNHYYNDVWILDVTTCLWAQLDIRGQQPQGRFSHTAVFTASDIAIYGGCGEDERPLNELLVLQLGAEHPNGRYNISMCKIFGNHWNQQKGRLSRETDDRSKSMLFGSCVVRKGAHEADLESKTFRFSSDTLHPKRRRATNSKAWEVESEQEEHSLSLSQHSSPSQSDQEQGTLQKVNDSVKGSPEFNLFKQLSKIRSNCQPNDVSSNQKESRIMVQRSPQDIQFLREQQKHPKPDEYFHFVNKGRQGTNYPPAEEKSLEGGPIQNLIGAEVKGKVDGAFDSGFLMTANVNGNIFRGVLFAPGPGIISRGAVLSQSPSMSHVAAAQAMPNSKPSLQPMTFPVPESGRSYQHPQVNRQYPVVRASPSLSKEPKLRSDLQGVILTLGPAASGSGNGGP
ncbi:Kelch_3 domain-containing protein/Kelch_4 domain-containing protein [Cephalotus follicularis]|uniref:Kelch_3 domain-containing protein/Kelch_4 domain-containing protein n=1 Tax=Cephalotus follicularis TaxID=3775 RepID=A0A1Q3CJ97_CEPFO|nr:Kelch_3 domain-containing protein/Kelch_4 domain-containing protein [Cephalotus follicularis]